MRLSPISIPIPTARPSKKKTHKLKTHGLNQSFKDRFCKQLVHHSTHQNKDPPIDWAHFRIIILILNFWQRKKGRKINIPTHLNNNGGGGGADRKQRNNSYSKVCSGSCSYSFHKNRDNSNPSVCGNSLQCFWRCTDSQDGFKNYNRNYKDHRYYSSN